MRDYLGSVRSQQVPSCVHRPASAETESSGPRHGSKIVEGPAQTPERSRLGTTQVLIGTPGAILGTLTRLRYLRGLSGYLIDLSARYLLLGIYDAPTSASTRSLPCVSRYPTDLAFFANPS
eukprot:1811238-Rhodomonas_salina.2